MGSLDPLQIRMAIGLGLAAGQCPDTGNEVRRFQDVAPSHLQGSLPRRICGRKCPNLPLVRRSHAFDIYLHSSLSVRRRLHRSSRLPTPQERQRIANCPPDLAGARKGNFPSDTGIIGPALQRAVRITDAAFLVSVGTPFAQVKLVASVFPEIRKPSILPKAELIMRRKRAKLAGIDFLHFVALLR